MTATFALLLAFFIGVVAGLRSLTAPAVVAWGVHLGWINLHNSPLAFMGSKWSLGIFTVLALVELLADKLPSAPARTAAVGVSARIVTGGLCGACLAVAGGAALVIGAAAGAIGGVAGAFGGYHARIGLARGLRVPDIVIAVPEDAVAIALGLFLVSRF